MDTTNEVMEMLRGIQNQLTELRVELAEYKKENNDLRQRNEEQERRIDVLERELRRKNIIIKGIADSDREDTDGRENAILALFKKMGIDRGAEVIELAVRLGRYEETKCRPVLIKLLSEKTKKEIMMNTGKLKGSEIWIEEDYSRKIREIRRKLVQEMKDRRNNGEEVYLRYDRLIVRGKPSEGNTVTDKRREGGGKRSTTERTPDHEKYERELRNSKNYRR